VATNQPGTSGRFLRFGEFEIDRKAEELSRNGRRVKLQRQPFLVLSHLLRAPGEVITREELRQELWPADTFVDFDHGVNEAINKLRSALGDSADSPRFVETLPRRGYRFIARVEEPGSAAAPAPKRRALLWGLGAFLAAAVLVTVLMADRTGWFRTGEPTGPIRSLAVLPLKNLSGDAKQDYFIEGITEELIARLARIRGLRVIARTSAAQYKDTSKPARQIARELKVDALLEGSVTWSGDRVRINTRLVHGPTDRSLWADTYEREVKDVLALQDEVAHAVARRIEVELTPQDLARFTRARQVVPGAYAAYLRGRYYWNKRTPEGLERGIEHFEEALREDSRFAAAYAGLADCYAALAAYNIRPPRQVMPKAKEAARRALEIDETMAEPHATLGFVMALYDWDWQGADREFQRALELNPGYASAHQWYAVYLVAIGRVDEAIAESDRAQELDPLSLSISEGAGWLRYSARRYDEAIDQFQQTLELDPNYGQALRYLGLSYLKKGMPGEAMAALERARSALGAQTDVQADLALAYALAGDRRMAEKMLEELTRNSRANYVSPFLIASFHIGLGRVDPALDWLEKAYQERTGNLIFLNVDPLFDKLRSEPRFEKLLKRIGLSP